MNTPSPNIMTAYIVDDHFINRNTLKFLIRKHFPDVIVIGESDDFLHAVLDIQKLKPDILFLDVELGDKKTGFHVMDALEQFDGSFICTAVDDRHAVEAFRYNAVHYLLTPIDPVELAIAIRRIKRAGSSAEELLSDKQIPSATISVVNNKGINLIPVDDILYAEAEGSYTLIVRNSGNIVMSRNLKYISQKLAGFSQFIRVHKSFLVNSEQIVSFKRPNTIVMGNKKLIPVSPTYKAIVDRLFKPKATNPNS